MRAMPARMTQLVHANAAAITVDMPQVYTYKLHTPYYKRTYLNWVPLESLLELRATLSKLGILTFTNYMRATTNEFICDGYPWGPCWNIDRA